MNIQLIAAVTLLILSMVAKASDTSTTTSLADLKNYQVNNAKMVSAGLPNKQHFEALKTMGVTHVVDLIPDDRTEQMAWMKKLDFQYHNIAVDWQNPTLKNFHDYVSAMQQSEKTRGITLTHCRLNWRGAVFTYLYRVTQLGEAEADAKQDMLAIWTPNDTWQHFINQVLAAYQ